MVTKKAIFGLAVRAGRDPGIDTGSRVLPVADQHGAGPLLGGDPHPGANTAPWDTSGAGQHRGTAGDSWVSSRVGLRTAALAVGL